MQVKELVQAYPYFDDADYAAQSDFYKLLFIPARAVQARELTQMQSLQHLQIKRLGDHLFKNGSMVIPGQISFDARYKSIVFDVSGFSSGVKENLQDPNYQKSTIIGKYLTDGQMRAVVDFIKNIDNNTIKLYIKYISGNADETEYEDGAIVNLADEDDNVILNGIEVGAKGTATSATITAGVFYINGLFCTVHEQSKIIAETSAPTLSVGLTVNESIVTENIDSSLVDPASGFSNYAAPGAHRHKITLTLEAFDPVNVFEDNDRYIELLRLRSGLATKIVSRSTYNILADELARRTYDESGDYTVKPFLASIENNEDDDTVLNIAVEAGKAYVKGYEIETLAKITLDTLQKSREFRTENNRTIHTPVGNYIIVHTPTETFPDVSTYGSANIYDISGTNIGNLKVRQILPLGTTVDPLVKNGSFAQYKLSVFDVRITSGYKFEQAYSIGSSAGKILIKLDVYKLPGLVSTTAANAGLTGNPDTRFGNLIEYGLPVGSIVAVGADATNPIEFRKVNTVTSNLAATVTANFTYSKSNVSYYAAYATLKETNNARLLFPLGFNRIKTIRDANGLVDTNYVYMRECTGAVSSNVAILTAPVGSDEFISTNPSDYIVFSSSSSGAPLASPTSVSVSGNQATLTWSALSNQNIKVFTQFRDTNAPEKSKTYTPNATYTFAASGVNAAMTKADFWLPNADIHSIVSIVDGSTDVTDDYTWDNGQNDQFYDLGRVTLKPGRNIPSSTVTVTYNYFAHSSGTYFSVNSYSINLIENGKGYKYIPTYISKSDGREWDLRDCLDFRPTINSTRTGFANTSNIPVGYVSADFQYYLNRIDVLALNSKGEFKVIKGIPDLDPKVPNIPSDSMALYQLMVRAYTFDKSDVFTKYIENKRYTMRDIGKLETRIANLEYYTTLNLLEKETADLEILDENGLDRFKNGFIADPFNGHGVGDVSNPEYRCSIDMQLGECRPIFSSNSLGLKPENISSVAKTGDLITLPYTSTVFISQPLATEFININPYNVFTFLGRIELVPPLDVWKDTSWLPDLIVNQEGNYDAMLATANAYGTVWGEWETQWTGKEVDRDVKRRVIAEGNNKPDRAHKSKWPDLVERTVTTTTTLTGTSTREGVRLTVTPKTVETPLGDKVVDVSYIPFMRSIDVQFTGKGFKPGTRLYAFFDGVNVSQYCSGGTTFNGGALIDSVPLVADATGFVQGVFRIPGNGTFKTGKRQFVLSDSTTNSELTRTTFGSAIFEASGLLETKQNTIISTRNAIVTPETVLDDPKIVKDVQTTSKTTVKWEDPLAQSFLISEEGGCFVSSVDLFFVSKDPNIPVIVYIAEMVNGYPSQNIVPFSQVIVPAANINTTTVTDVTTSAQLLPTTITFPSPVYLQQNCEYALVLISNSNAYNVAICTGGKPQIGTGVLTQNQPYLGTLFKSQNSSTWTTQQESDLMFRMRKCVFNTDTVAPVRFTNDSIGSRPINGISYLKPVSSGAATTKVKVEIKNHGLNPTTGRITLSGVSGSIGDISASALNATHRVTFADLDYVVFEVPSVTHTVGTGASGTIVQGSASGIRAITNLPFDSLYINARTITFPKTELNFGVKTTVGVHPQNTSALSTEYVTDTVTVPCMVNQTLNFNTRKMFVSDINKTINVSEPLAFSLIAELSSDNPNISPVIDCAGLAAFTIENEIDAPSKDFRSDFDLITIVPGASVVRSATDSTLSVATSTAYFTRVRVGQYVTTSGSTGSDGDYLVTDKVDNGTNQILTVSPAPTTATESITVKLNTKYIDEISPDLGSSKAKYVSRNFEIAQSASSIQIRFAAYWPNNFDIGVYYKILPVSGNRIFSEQKYVKAVQSVAQVYSNGPLNYREYTYDITNLEEFVALSGKIVFWGVNGNDVPKLKDLRILALT